MNLKFSLKSCLFLCTSYLLSGTACKNLGGDTTNEMTADTVAIEKDTAIATGEIAFKEITGYYFRIGQKTRDSLQFIHVSDSTEFRAWFGGGDLSIEGQEALNFDKNYIVAVVGTPKKMSTTVFLNSAYMNIGKLRLEFEVHDGEKTTENTRALYIVAISKPSVKPDGIHCYVNKRSTIYFALPQN
ncbi:MAG: hypothetical protein ABIV51_08840 [Saprospiraceae bacterium]